jgi:peptidoglycan/xylan/chitin deacetylase (PgdA/CDA1 family)
VAHVVDAPGKGVSPTAGTRDLVGYGARPPKMELPDSALVAVNIVINYEEGAEFALVDGDETREATSESVYDVPTGLRDLLQESAFEYGSRVGVWRVMRILDRAGVVATVFACGRALERNVDVAAAFVTRGYDFVGHGYRWRSHLELSEEDERREIIEAIESIERTTGQRIEGWFTRALPSENTRRLLVEQGLSYDSDSLADDVPFYVDVEGQPHLVVPYALDVNDIRFWKGSLTTGREWLNYATDAFDMLYADAQMDGVPRLLSVGLHPRIIGRPSRAHALMRLLEHVKQRERVWFCRRNDYAAMWRGQFLPPVPTSGD